MRLLIVIFSMIFALTRALPFPLPPNPDQSNSTPVQQPKSQQKQFTNQQQPQQKSNQNDQSVAETLDKDTNFVSSSILDNPSYDANMYSSFIPQDAIQQYVNHFGGGGYAPYTASVFPPPAPFAVQTGYEGFLVPDVNAIGDPQFAGPMTFLKGLIPKFFIGWLIKSASLLISTVGVVFFGAAITIAVCTLTPLCSISFSSIPLFAWRNTAEAVGKAIGSEITPERIGRTIEFVRTAIDKFTALQNAINNSDDDE